MIDLSGNPLGLLRGEKKSNNNYSASRIKSTVTATATAYMTQGLGFLKKGLGSSFSTLEGDDEEDPSGADDGDDDTEEESEAQIRDRCGLKALANGFIDGNTEQEDHPASSPLTGTTQVGLRRTFCDTAGAEALAAMTQRQEITLRLDMRLNPVLGEDIMIDALHGGKMKNFFEKWQIGTF